MTATLPVNRNRTTDTGDPQWREDLAQVLRPQIFPASQDEILATLIRLRAPSRLLWRLTCLPRTRRFGSVDEVCDYVDHHATAATLGVPL